MKILCKIFTYVFLQLLNETVDIYPAKNNIFLLRGIKPRYNTRFYKFNLYFFYIRFHFLTNYVRILNNSKYLLMDLQNINE